MRKVVDLQIRKMPAVLRDKLRRRAKSKRVSMSQYVIEILRDDMDRPTIDEWLEEVRRLPRVPQPAGLSGADLVREARREWDEELAEETDS